MNATLDQTIESQLNAVVLKFRDLKSNQVKRADAPWFAKDTSDVILQKALEVVYDNKKPEDALRDLTAPALIAQPVATTETEQAATVGRFQTIAQKAIKRGEKRILPIAIGGKNPAFSWANLEKNIAAGVDTRIDTYTTEQWDEVCQEWVNECSKRFKDFNACVVAKPDEFVFIDCDTHREFVTGYETFAGEKFPVTYTTSARENRTQIHFRQTDASRALGNVVQFAVNGIDLSVRQRNEYVIAEGSLHAKTGTPYIAIVDGNIVAMPDKLVEYIKHLKATAGKDSTSNWTGSEQTLAAIPRNTNGKMMHGSYHGAMLTVAGYWRARGLDANAIEEKLVEFANVNFEPPVDWTKVTKMSVSICTFPVENKPIELNQTPTIEVDAKDVVESGLILPVSTILASTVLGELYQKVFEPNGWPVELALPALVTAASVLVPEATLKPGVMNLESPFTHLYTALIGDVNVGKSQVTDWAVKALGIHADLRGQHYIKSKFGSAEQMWKFMTKYKSTFKDSVLVNPDEWSHVMAKAGIPDSSFASTLTTAFYNRRHSVTLGGARGGIDLEIPFSFSIIGGVVDKDFDSVFGATTIGGLYDRFLFGVAPKDFSWVYRPFPREHSLFHDLMDEYPRGYLKLNPVPVAIDPSVFELSMAWKKKDPAIGRITEVCIRVATIFASIDGRSVVTGADLEKLAPLAEYQKAVRGLYRPNPGLNYDAIYANTALGWINTHAGQWRTLRDLQRGTNYQRKKLGPRACFQALDGLAKSHEIEIWVSEKVKQLDGTWADKPLPSGYDGIRPRQGAGLVRKVHH